MLYLLHPKNKHRQIAKSDGIICYDYYNEWSNNMFIYFYFFIFLFIKLIIRPINWLIIDRLGYFFYWDIPQLINVEIASLKNKMLK